jgi:hypothetical protein
MRGMPRRREPKHLGRERLGLSQPDRLVGNAWFRFVGPRRHLRWRPDRCAGLMGLIGLVDIALPCRCQLQA